MNDNKDEDHDNYFTGNAQNLNQRESTDYLELLETLIHDEDFKVNYDEIKLKENIFKCFIELDNTKKLEILLRIWFIVFILT